MKDNIIEKINKVIKQANEILQQKNISTRIKAINFSFDNTQDIESYIEQISSTGKFLLENEKKIIFQLDKSYLTQEDENQLISIEKHVGKSSVEVVCATDNQLDAIEVGEMKITFVSQDFIAKILDQYQRSKEENKQNQKKQQDDNEEINKLKELLERERSARLELMADFQNFRKRMEEERSVFGAISNLNLVNDVLEVYDDINLALQDEGLNFDQAKTSLKSAQDKLNDAIEKVGVERIDVKVGDKFDKNIMEAISTIDVESEKKGTVVAVINSAIKFKNRNEIIRAAKVVVGK